MSQSSPSKRRTFLRRLLKVCLGLLLTPGVYLGMAWLLGAWSVNEDFQPDPGGIEIFIRSNGVHTDIIVPRDGFSDWFLPEHFQAAPETADFVAIGWGHKGVYLEIPRWSDLSVGLALNAALGLGDSVGHVSLMERPAEGERCRSTWISPEQHERLASFIKDSFQLDENGRPIPLADAHYHSSDAFYQAHGRYSFLNTCNVWTGDALRQAGLPTGVWTPLAKSILSHFPL